jgi:hypothetical protein
VKSFTSIGQKQGFIISPQPARRVNFRMVHPNFATIFQSMIPVQWKSTNFPVFRAGGARTGIMKDGAALSANEWNR